MTTNITTTTTTSLLSLGGDMLAIVERTFVEGLPGQAFVSLGHEATVGSPMAEEDFARYLWEVAGQGDFVSLNQVLPVLDLLDSGISEEALWEECVAAAKYWEEESQWYLERDLEEVLSWEDAYGHLQD